MTTERTNPIEQVVEEMRALGEYRIWALGEKRVAEKINAWADRLSSMQGEAVAWRVEWDQDDEGDAGCVTLDISERGAMLRANEAIAEGYKGVRIRPLYTRPQPGEGGGEELLSEVRIVISMMEKFAESEGSNTLFGAWSGNWARRLTAALSKGGQGGEDGQT